MSTLEGKVAIVTGAGTGIGKGIAIHLSKHGAKVVVNYNSSYSGAEDTKEQIKKLGGKAITVKADVTNRIQILEMMKETAETFGGIDILVNNSALETHNRLLDYDEEDFYRVMRVNLKGYFMCIQAAVPFLKLKKQGRIINISSIHAKRPTDFDPVYCMTKGGIKMLTREAAIELAKYGITVNAIEPGYIDIKSTKSGNPKPVIDKTIEKQPNEFEYKKNLPIGHVGEPQDIACVVSFIASDESLLINGTSIRVDGGNILL